jgi:hypothetical protein
MGSFGERNRLRQIQYKTMWVYGFDRALVKYMPSIYSFIIVQTPRTGGRRSGLLLHVRPSIMGACMGRVSGVVHGRVCHGAIQAVTRNEMGLVTLWTPSDHRRHGGVHDVRAHCRPVIIGRRARHPPGHHHENGCDCENAPPHARVIRTWFRDYRGRDTMADAGASAFFIPVHDPRPGPPRVINKPSQSSDADG